MQKINLQVYLKKRKQRISFFSISPTFDWVFIVIISICLFIFGALYIGKLYMKILDESLFIVSVDQKAQNELETEQKNIEKTIEKIEMRNVLIAGEEQKVEEEILTNRE